MLQILQYFHNVANIAETLKIVANVAEFPMLQMLQNFKMLHMLQCFQNVTIHFSSISMNLSTGRLFCIVQTDQDVVSLVLLHIFLR